ncbi:hypothetical protein A9Q84_14135 [Halobacteriovorax marinus]|uniref:Uncharacterized protein n=1 Tax=Halobacteriovorax marinus TaxID=97084 RepID=A0A1Y5F570_9BACT|nr:hypothetical protein A9Q84_14135 [Halobacteriovorax marinus]
MDFNAKKESSKKAVTPFVDTPTKIITIATGEWPPYIGKELANKGCLAKILIDIYESQGHKVKFFFMPWRRAYVDSKMGKYDATAYWFDSRDRRVDFIFPKNNISVEQSYFYYLKNKKIDWKDFSDLAGKKVILNHGYTYNDKFIDALKKYKIQTQIVSNEMQNFKMLTLDRGDFTIISEKTADVYLKKLDQNMRRNIVKDHKPAITSLGYLLISKLSGRGEKLAEVFNKGYEQVLSNNQYKDNYIKNCSAL